MLAGRVVYWIFGGGVGAFLLGLSVAWKSGGTFALLVGVAAGLAWIAAGLAFATWRRRARLAAVAARGRPTAR
jgi:hypothetical protein